MRGKIVGLHRFVVTLARTRDMPDALHRLTCNWILISDASRMAIKVGLFFITNAALLENFNWPRCAILFWLNSATHRPVPGPGSHSGAA